MTGSVRQILYSQQIMMDGSAATELVPEAAVELGPPVVEMWRLAELPPAYRRRIDLDGCVFPSVEMLFQLPELPEGRQFAAFRLAVHFDPPSTVLQLEPPRTRTTALPDTLDVGSIPARSAVTVWGEERSEVRWRFLAGDQTVINEGDGRVRMLVKVPAATPVLVMRVSGAATVQRRRSGRLRSVEAVPQPDDAVRFAMPLPA